MNVNEAKKAKPSSPNAPSSLQGVSQTGGILVKTWEKGKRNFAYFWLFAAGMVVRLGYRPDADSRLGPKMYMYYGTVFGFGKGKFGNDGNLLRLRSSFERHMLG